MKTHKVSVSDRALSYPFNDRVISQNVKTDTISATFDDEWKSVTSAIAVFANGDVVKRVSVSIKSGACTVTIPWETLEEPGFLFVTFVGYLSGGSRLVTEMMARPFRVAEGGYVDGGDTDEATPDLIQQAIDATAAAISASRTANSAASAANAAASSANSAARSANTAAASAQTEASAASTAAAQASSAATAANNATTSANNATSAANAAATAANKSKSAADTATANANNAAKSANDAAQAATDAVDDAVSEIVPSAVADAVAAEMARYSAVSFSVNPDDGGLDITYSY